MQLREIGAAHLGSLAPPSDSGHGRGGGGENKGIANRERARPAAHKPVVVRATSNTGSEEENDEDLCNDRPT